MSSLPQAANAQSPFAGRRCYRRQSVVSRHFEGHYPFVLALTGSCASPYALSPPSTLSPSESLCRLRPTPAARLTFPTLSLQIFPWMPGPYIAAVSQVLPLLSSLALSGLPQRASGSAARKFRQATSRRALFRDCHHSIQRSGLQVCSPPRSLPPLRFTQGSRDFYFRAEHA